jgi:biopolymer transport protein ExbB/biopolymer transport protein TolQ
MANWVQLMGWGARAIMLVLLVLSVWSVAIMLDRRKVFRSELAGVTLDELKMRIESSYGAGLKDWAEKNPSFLAGVVRVALGAGGGSESVDRAVQAYLTERKLMLERGLSVLATFAANSAFIGLLGTVMGIIQSFGILSSQQGSAMNAVMFGLAEALVTTAIGIFVAVPAAIAYNHYSQKLRNATQEASAVRDWLISRAGR